MRRSAGAVFLALALFGAGCGGGSSTTSSNGGNPPPEVYDVSVSVDAAQAAGTLNAKKIAAGVNFWGPATAQSRFQTDIGASLYRIKVLFDETENVDGPFTRSGHVYLVEVPPVIDAVHALGGKVMLELYGVPQWLSSCPTETTVEVNNIPNFARCFPTDNAQWGTMVSNFLARLGSPVDYLELFGEASLGTTWKSQQPTEADSQTKYVDMYEATYDAISGLSPRPKIGGLAYTVLPVNSFISWTDAVIAEINQRNLQRVSPLPFEYYSWHLYKGYLPVTIDTVMTTVRDRLTLLGKGDIEIIASEWNVDFLPNDVRHDNQYGSAFAVRTLQAMVDAGLDYQTFYSLALPDLTPAPTRYSGDFGLFTSDSAPIPKASYNAFRLFSGLETDRISLESDSPATTFTAVGAGGAGDQSFTYRPIDGLAAMDADSLSVLAAYFVPVEDAADASYTATREVRFTIANVPFAQYHYKIYRIDGDYGNGYPDGVSPELEVVEEGDRSGAFEEILTVPVYGVVMIRLTAV